MKFVNQIIREAIVERATDIHVEPLENDLRIRYRIDGILHEVAVPPQLRLLQSAIISRLKVMAHMDIAERRLPQDGRINLQAHDAEHRRPRFDHSDGERRIDQLAFAQPRSAAGVRFRTARSQRRAHADHEIAAGAAERDHPRHRSDRLRQIDVALLFPQQHQLGRSAASSRSRNRWNIGCPGVSQIDVKPEIDLTFAKGLRHILRQDPNVVMVGEIRDVETADISIRAAMTGHLVFSTLHTNDAVGGITRLLDMDVEPFLLASVVKAFIAQRLVRTICPDCAEIGRLSERISGGDRYFHAKLGTRFQRGAGCEHCRQTGYLGRLAIYEICVVTEPLKKVDHAKTRWRRAEAMRDRGRNGDVAAGRLASGGGRKNDDRRSRARHAD